MAKQAPLRIVWSKRENDFVVHYDRSPSDGSWFFYLLDFGMRELVKDDRAEHPVYFSAREKNQRFREALRNRGFDPDTFRVQVKRLKPKCDGSVGSSDTGSDGAQGA